MTFGPTNVYGVVADHHQALATMEVPFSFTLVGRTVTPLGNLNIFGSPYRPDPQQGAITMTGSVLTRVDYDLCAVPVSESTYALKVFYRASNITPPNSYTCRLIGTLIDFPTFNVTEVLLLPTLAVNTYIEPLADGFHVHPFAGVAAGGGYGRLVVESLAGDADVTIFALTGSSGISSPGALNFSAGDTLGGISIYNSNGSITLGTNAGQIITVNGGSVAIAPSTLVGITAGTDILAGALNSIVLRTGFASTPPAGAAGSITLLAAAAGTINIGDPSITPVGGPIKISAQGTMNLTAKGSLLAITAGQVTIDAPGVSGVTIQTSGTGGLSAPVVIATNGNASAQITIQTNGTGGITISSAAAAFLAAAGASQLTLQAVNGPASLQTTGSGQIYVQAVGTGGVSITSAGASLALQQSNGTAIGVITVNNLSSNAGAYTQMYATGGRAYLQSVSSGISILAGLDVLIQSGGAGSAVLQATGTGIVSLQAATGGIQAITTGAGAISISGGGAGQVLLRSIGAGNVVVQSSSGFTEIQSISGYVVIVASTGGQPIYNEADTHYYYNGSTSTYFGFNNASAFHHNTAVSAPTKAFVIPHPLIPGNVLSYAAVEMPEACVIHRGTATLDATGKAALVVPSYLRALIDMTKINVYVTSIGPTPFACSYQYAGELLHGSPNGMVSWMLVGMRLDIPPHAVVTPEPPGYDAGAFPYPNLINAMRDTVGAAHLPALKPINRGPLAPHTPVTPPLKAAPMVLSKKDDVRHRKVIEQQHSGGSNG